MRLAAAGLKASGSLALLLLVEERGRSRGSPSGSSSDNLQHALEHHSTPTADAEPAASGPGSDGRQQLLLSGASQPLAEEWAQRLQLATWAACECHQASPTAVFLPVVTAMALGLGQQSSDAATLTAEFYLQSKLLATCETTTMSAYTTLAGGQVYRLRGCRDGLRAVAGAARRVEGIHLAAAGLKADGVLALLLLEQDEEEGSQDSLSDSGVSRQRQQQQAAGSEQPAQPTPGEWAQQLQLASWAACYSWQSNMSYITMPAATIKALGLDELRSYPAALPTSFYLGGQLVASCSAATLACYTRRDGSYFYQLTGCRPALRAVAQAACTRVEDLHLAAAGLMADGVLALLLLEVEEEKGSEDSLSGSDSGVLRQQHQHQQQQQQQASGSEQPAQPTPGEWAQQLQLASWAACNSRQSPGHRSILMPAPTLKALGLDQLPSYPAALPTRLYLGGRLVASCSAATLARSTRQDGKHLHCLTGCYSALKALAQKGKGLRRAAAGLTADGVHAGAVAAGSERERSELWPSWQQSRLLAAARAGSAAGQPPSSGGAIRRRGSSTHSSCRCSCNTRPSGDVRTNRRASSSGGASSSETCRSPGRSGWACCTRAQHSRATATAGREAARAA